MVDDASKSAYMELSYVNIYDPYTLHNAHIPLTSLSGRLMSYNERREMFVDAVKNKHIFMYSNINDPLVVLGINTAHILRFTLTFVS